MARNDSEKMQDPEKTSVLQEAKVFHETPISPKKCAEILANILYMISKGEALASKEATECFFAITKLFQNHDPVLRRMVYLAIKSLANTADDVIIVTSSLTKDMTGKEESFRASAMRALCSVTKDPLMLQSSERYMKQAIVDKNPNIATSALVSSIKQAQMSGGGFEVVKRWSNEAIEALSSDDIMVQYHALGFLYIIRKCDQRAVSKMVFKLVKTQSLKSCYAICHLIRITALLIEDGNTETSLIDFIESCLRHKSEMVVFEAANAMVNLSKITGRELTSSLSALQMFCSSSITAIRFAAVRTLNQISINYPGAVSACNLDLETLIADSNRSIATLAITTLLKTGAESSVDRLMTQISSFVNEISDEFKVVVVQAIRSLCIKFPRKQSILMTFLSTMLREEGGLNYKSCIAETFISLIEEFPDAKESGLLHLCEFIEDCEHTNLAIKVIHFLGIEGPKALEPSKYIRYIYNRVILEVAEVRAAAVSTLAKFGAHCKELLPNILVLLQRCQLDNDDEVRDRATYYKHCLEMKAEKVEFSGLDVSISSLERALHSYTLSDCAVAFDWTTVPKAIIQKKKELKKKQEQPKRFHEERLYSIPQIKELGPLFKTSKALDLTETETEIKVQCIKHVFKNNIVLEFLCTNTLQDQLLENVDISVEPPESYSVIETIPCPKLDFEHDRSICAILSIPQNVADYPGSVAATLKFTIKDCDPVTGEPDCADGFIDEYALEDVSINLADFMQNSLKSSFVAAWEDLGPMNEISESYSLTEIRSLENGVQLLIEHLGMSPSERSELIPEDGKSSHTLLLAGQLLGGIDVLAKTKLVLADHVSMNLCVRATDQKVVDLVTQSLT